MEAIDNNENINELIGKLNTLVVQEFNEQIVNVWWTEYTYYWDENIGHNFIFHNWKLLDRYMCDTESTNVSSPMLIYKIIGAKDHYSDWKTARGIWLWTDHQFISYDIDMVPYHTKEYDYDTVILIVKKIISLFEALKDDNNFVAPKTWGIFRNSRKNIIANLNKWK